MAASLDAISGGRLILGLGTGWHEGEFKAYGYPYEPPAARVRRLEETARIMRKMWTEEAPSFKGRFYSIHGAYCSPKPVQKPGPPLLIAGGGEQLTLRTAARHADISNFAAWMGTPEGFKAKSEALDRHCVRVGRDPAKVRRSWAAYTLITETQEGAEMSMKQYTRKVEARYGGASGTRRPPLAGTSEQIVEQVTRYVDAGVSLFIIRFMGENLRREAEVFADEVVPNFQ
jgi:alkanesulfonate monooxygenase SsuD/methylene tetrahydromethanopterin reductase-like flavin-dependent oxidoreductase (luciferase family)